MLLLIGAGFGISLVGAALVALLFHSQTADGTIVIDPQGHAARVAVSRGGVPIDTISAENGWRLVVAPGEYRLAIESDDGRLQLDSETVEVTPGKEAMVKVNPSVAEIIGTMALRGRRMLCRDEVFGVIAQFTFREVWTT